MKANLAKLFSPRAIAIYGVSQDTSKIGSTIFNNILASGYNGGLFAINPKYNEVYGYRCYPNAESIPHRVDVAIMAIPGSFALEVLDDCAKRGIRFLVIISAGFSETGEQGAALEKQVAQKAKELEITILGPNCLGLLVADSNLNASFAANDILPGNIAFLSQSGAVCTAMLDLSRAKNLGFSHFVSVGNKLNLSENDLVEYWLHSPKVKVIGAYLEEFADGYDLCSLKERTDQEKPMVIIHPGKSEVAQKAISSHTGSLAGEDVVVTAALRKAGVTRVDSLQEAYAAMMAFSLGKIPQGKRVAIITNAGGPGILATDCVASDETLTLAELSEETKTALRAGLPETASVHNPVDIIGDAMSDRYGHALNVLSQASEVDAILVILTPQLVTQIEDTAKLLINMNPQTAKPIIPVMLGGVYAEGGLRRLYDNRIPSFNEIEMAVKSLGHLVRYSNYLKTKKQEKLSVKEIKQKHKVDLDKYVTERLVALPEKTVIELLNDFEFDTPKAAVIHSFEEALAFTKDVKYPVVIKATTEDVPHKTDFKALFLNIKTDEELKLYLTQLQKNIYDLTKKEHPAVLIQEQILAKEELLIGIRRDGDSKVYEHDGLGFGHLIVFGKGGIYTEVYKDVAEEILPLTEKQIKKLISRTKISQIIKGTRGEKPLAEKALVETIQKLQSLVATYPEIAEVDINPALLTHKRSVVVDAKLFVKA